MNAAMEVSSGMLPRSAWEVEELCAVAEAITGDVDDLRAGS